MEIQLSSASIEFHNNSYIHFQRDRQWFRDYMQCWLIFIVTMPGFNITVEWHLCVCLWDVSKEVWLKREGPLWMWAAPSHSPSDLVKRMKWEHQQPLTSASFCGCKRPAGFCSCHCVFPAMIFQVWLKTNPSILVVFVGYFLTARNKVIILHIPSW